MRLQQAVVTGAFAAVLASGPIGALAAANPFSDVQPNSWAYQAIQQLAADGIIQGYPDGKFKGQRPITRYEASVLTYRAVQKLEAELADEKTAQQVQQRDLDAARKLLDEYGDDIKSLKSDVATLKKDDAATKKVLARQQFHLYYFLRAPGFVQDNVSAYNGPVARINAAGPTTGAYFTPANGALASHTTLIPSGNNANGLGQQGFGQNNLQSGQNTHGTGYQVLRLVFSGNVDERTSYAVRLENRYYFDNAQNFGGVSTSTPQFCPNVACGPDYPNNTSVRLNYANVTYKFNPNGNGAYVTGGRMVLQDGPLGLNFSDYYNGVQLGYHSPNVDAFAVYSFYDAGATNGINNNNKSGQALAGNLAVKVTPKLLVGGAYDTEINQASQLWNASARLTGAGGAVIPGITGVVAGAYQTYQTPITTGSVYMQFQPTKLVTIQGEGLHRFGRDPSTGNNWQQPDSVWGALLVGNTAGKQNSNYGEGGFIQSGFNSNNYHTQLVGTTGYQQLYVTDPNGYRIYYFGLHHWFSDNARIGLVYQHYGLVPGTDIPAGGPTCPGCYIARDDRNALVLQTLLSF